MNTAKLLNRIRCYIAVAGFSIGAGIFWGVLAAGTVRLTFDIEEVHALLFVGLPVAVAFIPWGWKKLPRLLGFDDTDLS